MLLELIFSGLFFHIQNKTFSFILNKTQKNSPGIIYLKRNVLILYLNKNSYLAKRSASNVVR